MTDQQQDLLLALGRLEGKMDALIAITNAHNETIQKHDERLRELENSRSALIGAVAILSTAISAGVAWLAK
tara:strand:+ start:1535 stop:1747 length:213 start_codon:yes stop_codon:yes gene_type:complete